MPGPRFGPDRTLMLLYFPRRVRPGVAALWAIDEAMGAAIARASQPAVAGIKLAWWREALERLDADPAPSEPRLRAAVAHLLPLGISGFELGQLEEGWAGLLAERPDASVVAKRGERLFALQSKLIEAQDPTLTEAGALFALGDAMRRGLGKFADERSVTLKRLAGKRIKWVLRPVSLAARLAARRLDEPEGIPARAAALLVHRVTGVITGGR